ncbi:MAG: hypothetical protein LIP09_00760 [Bacteroidales bacterium]|nr:hypothetical protein [Bacteroidales bacterium]
MNGSIDKIFMLRSYAESLYRQVVTAKTDEAYCKAVEAYLRFCEMIVEPKPKKK